MDDDLSEFEWLGPSRVDAVGTPANGIGFLMLKSVDPDTFVAQFVDGLCGTRACPVCKGRYDELTPDMLVKARMKAKERHALDDSDFAFPKERKDPLNDEAHVRDALGRFSQTEGVSAEEKHEAARRILARAKHFGIDVSEDSDVAQAAKQTAPDKDLHRSEAESQTREVDEGPEGPCPPPDADDGGEPKRVDFPHGAEGDGQGDTAPDKDLHRDEAESQTHADPAVKAEGDGTGTHESDGDVSPAESESQTKDNEDGNAEKGDANSSPGSTAWEHKDVALGEKAERLVAQLAEVVHTFTEREKAEGASKSTRRIVRQVRRLLENPSLLKETEVTDVSELLKALDERDVARRAEKQARKAAEAKKAAKAERKAAKAAEKAAKAAGVEESDELAKARAELVALSERVEKMEAEDGKRVAVNAAGPVAHLRGQARESGEALKSFDDQIRAAEEAVVAATTPMAKERALQDRAAALRRRLLAKSVAQENARERGDLPASRLGPNWSSVIKEGSSYTIGEDTSLQFR